MAESLLYFSFLDFKRMFWFGFFLGAGAKVDIGKSGFLCDATLVLWLGTGGVAFNHGTRRDFGWLRTRESNHKRTSTTLKKDFFKTISFH